MSFLLLCDRVLEKVATVYRKAVFKRYIGCHHNDFSLVGKLTVINPHITLGHNVTIYPDCMFFGDGKIEIGDNVNIGNGTVIYASKTGGVTIGNNAMIAADCYIIDMDHGIAAGRYIHEQENAVSPVMVGEGVWLGTGCKVLKGSVIGNGAVVGAMGLVKGTLPDNSVSVGIPAKVIKYRE